MKNTNTIDTTVLPHQQCIAALSYKIQRYNRPLLLNYDCNCLVSAGDYSDNDNDNDNDSYCILSIPIDENSSFAISILQTQDTNIYWIPHRNNGNTCNSLLLQNNYNMRNLYPIPVSIKFLIPYSAMSFNDTTNSNTQEEIETLQKQIITYIQVRIDYEKNIAALHLYNQLKDICQDIFGKIVEIRGGVIRDMYIKYGLDLND